MKFPWASVKYPNGKMEFHTITIIINFHLLCLFIIF